MPIEFRGNTLNRLQAILLTIAAVFAIPSESSAQEPVEQFLSGLRERRYFDTALEYIADLEKRTDLSPEVSDILELERGITYREMGASSRVPEDREQYLGQSETALRKFVAAHADHPQAAFANAELGELLFDRARSLIWEAEAPSAEERRSELQQQARQLIEQAKTIYETARNEYQKQVNAFPKFIDQNKESKLFQERQRAEAKFLRAWFSLVRCTYERGQTFDRGAKERKDELIKAASLFEEIHTSYRTNPIGVQSRLMMGKCFQEQDDINRALGIYNEIIDHRSQTPFMIFLKDTAVHYRLICLNHESRASYDLVLNEASAWLQANRRRSLSEPGRGILWEKAVAGENLAKDRTIDPTRKQALLKQAMNDAEQVGKYQGPFREPAIVLARRLKAELGEKDREPRDFDTAFERARGKVSQIQEFRTAVDKAANSKEKTAATEAVTAHFNEIGRLLQLALKLREHDSDPKAVAQARYLLSFVFMQQRKNFDAVILAQYCMEQDREADEDTALSATEIAISAAVQAWNDAPPNDREFEAGLIKTICQLVIDEYPTSRRGNEARIRLGKVHRELNEPLLAAKAFLDVAQSDAGYASARLEAGQAYWAAWTQTAADIENGQHPEQNQETMKQWKTEARMLLQQGIQLVREKLGPDAAPTDELIAAEVSLATIMNQDGQFQQTIQRLTAGGDRSIAKSVEMQGERPAKGVRSQSFVGLMYRLLLRAYVGTQQIEQAIATMDQLTKIGGQDTTAVYTQLGQELQEELKRLKTSGETERLSQVRNSFEQFLEKVYQQRDKQDYNSLLWIGETYFGLGQGVADDANAAAGYFQKASTTYQEILDTNLATEGSVTAIQLRLIRCRRHQGLYEEALDLAQQVLRKNSLTLDVQFEAAHTMADWGADPAGDPQKLLQSIDGLGDDGAVWGWSNITKKLQRQMGSDEWDQLRNRFLEARFELTNSRYRYAVTDPPDRKQQLQAALAEITVFSQVFQELDDVWWNRFDQLYQEIQAELGQNVTPLVRPEAPELPPELVVQAEVSNEKANPAATDTVAQDSTEAEGSGLLFSMIAMALAAGGGFMFYKLMSKPAVHRKSTYRPTTFAPPPGVGSARERTEKSRSKVVSGSASSGGAPTAQVTKKKRKLTPEEKAARAARAALKESPREGRPDAEPSSDAAPRKKVRKRPPSPPAPED